MLAAASPARADPPDAALAFVTGASVLVAGFIAGGAVLGSASAATSGKNAGWLTMEAGFALAPVVSHAVAGEWGRGLLFGAPAAACWGGTLALFQVDPDTIDHGSIEEQRVMWSLFGVAILSGMAGVVDAALAAGRAAPVAVAPIVGADRVGLAIGATL
jgi:hypothetical protein